MDFENIIVEKKEGYAVVTINRPKVMNALNPATIEELGRAFGEFAKDRSVLGVILTGEGKAFVAGADLGQGNPGGPENPAELTREIVDQVHQVYDRIENFQRPVIAAVNGYALGGGCELALCCDIRIASEHAVFGLPEVNLGVIPCYGGLQRLPRLVGSGIAKEMIFTARYVKAEEAEKMGLVNKVVPAEQLMEEAETMMKTIVSKAPIAVKYAKVCVNRGMELSLDYALELEKDFVAMCATTEDAREGGMAFFEKRAASFKNK